MHKHLNVVVYSANYDHFKESETPWNVYRIGGAVTKLLKATTDAPPPKVTHKRVKDQMVCGLESDSDGM